MSAFVVSNKHISALVKAAHCSYPGNGPYYYWHNESHFFLGNLEDIGQKLVDENLRSVNYRYDEQECPEPFILTPTPDYPLAALLKACDCYEYQACETPDWRDTEAWAILDAIRSNIISRLPGYEEAEWHID
jgi:hypothetical protein